MTRNVRKTQGESKQSECRQTLARNMRALIYATPNTAQLESRVQAKMRQTQKAKKQIEEKKFRDIKSK